MPYIKAKSLNPQHGVGYHASFFGVAAEALAKNDLVIATGAQGDRVKFSKANASALVLANGVMGIADHAAASGGSIRVVSHKIVKGLNTSGSGLGALVFLADASGVHALSAGTQNIVVGNVLTVANPGKVLLAPAHVVRT